jgi:myo-inositol-1(or 4)-monophosphatase
MELEMLIVLMHTAVRRGMKVVREAQLHPKPARVADIKSDGTLVTSTDKQSEKEIHDVLRSLPGTRFLGEEGTRSGEGEILLIADPLDGTRAFSIGLATSTVIVAALREDRVVAVVTGEPSTGRIWSTWEDKPTMLEGGVRETPEEVSVWKGSLGGKRQAVVFTDLSCGFTRSGRQIFTDEQVLRLIGAISAHARLLMPGSNGLHLALVANGGEFMAGQVTTAVGGAWDVASVLLVLNAGGAARAFSTKSGALEEVDPLRIFDVDIIVTGNCELTVDLLVNLVRMAAS